MKKIEEAKMELAKMMEEAKMEKANEILQLCFEINRLEPRKREVTGNKQTVFFEFSGHTAEINIKIFETGWFYSEGKNKYPHADMKFVIYLNYPFEEIEPEMENCIQYLKSLKESMEEGDENEHLQQAV